LKKIPYNEKTVKNKRPRKTLVLYKAKMSKALESFNEKNCINGKTITRNITKISIEKSPKIDVIIKNQKENPPETANALNLGDDNSILDWIHESYNSRL